MFVCLSSTRPSVWAVPVNATSQEQFEGFVTSVKGVSKNHNPAVPSNTGSCVINSNLWWWWRGTHLSVGVHLPKNKKRSPLFYIIFPI